MNWTSRKPIENVKCIVETNTGCVFPAHYIKGTWWNTEKAFPIDGVTKWIVYPEGEEPNDYIAPEALLKYLIQAYREAQTKLEFTRELNKKLCKEFSQIKSDSDRIQKENESMKQELIQIRKQARKGRTLQNNLRKLLDQSAMLDVCMEGEKEQEFVA